MLDTYQFFRQQQPKVFNFDNYINFIIELERAHPKRCVVCNTKKMGDRAIDAVSCSDTCEAKWSDMKFYQLQSKIYDWPRGK